MVIAVQEEIWRRTCSITCSNMNRRLLSLRYVDNRLWISERRFEQFPGVRLFLNSRFYGGDIILEDEPAYDFVGFSLGLHNRRIHYNRHQGFAQHLFGIPRPSAAQWRVGKSPHHQ